MVPLGGVHFIHTVRHVHVLDHGHFTDIVSALGRSRSITLTCGKNIEKDTTVIVYDNKNLHITELEDTRPVFILFYFIHL